MKRKDKTMQIEKKTFVNTHDENIAKSGKCQVSDVRWAGTCCARNSDILLGVGHV